MPTKKPALAAARITDAISCHAEMIVTGESLVLIGSTAPFVPCKDCKGRELSGSPVNVSYGMKVLPNEVDFGLPVPSMFVWQRYYASDTLGQGWRTR